MCPLPGLAEQGEEVGVAESGEIDLGLELAPTPLPLGLLRFRIFLVGMDSTWGCAVAMPGIPVTVPQAQPVLCCSFRDFSKHLSSL